MEDLQETRERIIAVASRLFRERGLAAVGLAEIAAAAGLSPRSFYAHFESKEALIQMVMVRSLAQDAEDRKAAVNLEAAVRLYLSREHRDAPATGCPLGALATEVARRPLGTRETVTRSLTPSVRLLIELLSSHRGAAVEEADALAFLGLLAGTLQLARVITEPARSDAVLEAGVRAALVLA